MVQCVSLPSTWCARPHYGSMIGPRVAIHRQGWSSIRTLVRRVRYPDSPKIQSRNHAVPNTILENSLLQSSQHGQMVLPTAFVSVTTAARSSFPSDYFCAFAAVRHRLASHRFLEAVVTAQLESSTGGSLRPCAPAPVGAVRAVVATAIPPSTSCRANAAAYDDRDCPASSAPLVSQVQHRPDLLRHFSFPPRVTTPIKTARRLLVGKHVRLVIGRTRC